ncbi:MAG: aspartate aminotransferase family protein, partial [Chloroflexota bacterium]
GIPLSVARAGSALTPFFRASTPANYAEAREADTATFAKFHAGMLDQGVLLPPSQFECWFVSLAHDEALIDRTIEAAAAALAGAKAG